MINNGVAKIDDSYGKLSIIIPSKKNWPVLIFGILFISSVIAFTNKLFFKMSIGQLQNQNIDVFELVWSFLWILGILNLIFLILWGFFGQEIIIVENGLISIKKAIFNVGFNKKLDINQVKNLRFKKVETSIFSGNQKNIWGLGPGKINLDYGLKTYSFGLGIDDAEVNYIIEILSNKIK